MSAGISPLVALEVTRLRQAELTRNAERARIVGGLDTPRIRHPLRNAVLVAMILAVGAALLLLAF